MFTKMLGRIQKCFSHTIRHLSSVQYVQGQSPKQGVREYFYFIDHQGQLFLDDARIKNFTSCFKEKKFLKFFFERLRINDIGSYQDKFPYLSPCGREKNYVRCDDLPVVFTSLEVLNGKLVLPYNYCGTMMMVDFQPTKLYMGTSGRVYHPGPERLHGIGLIKSHLAIEFSHGFTFDDAGQPTHFNIRNSTYVLDNSLKRNLRNLGRPGE